MKIYKYISLILLLLFISGNFIYAGGGNRNGTGGANELLIPVGVRGIGLGGANVSTTRGLEALYWNPAGISKTEHTAEATFSYMSYIADIGVTYGAVSASVPGIGTFALNVKSLSVGSIDVTTNRDPDGTGQSFSPQFLTVGASYSRSLSDRIAIGLTGNIITESLGQVSATGIAFDIGVSYENLGNVNGLSLGVVVKNLGPQMRFDGPGLYRNATVDELNRGSGFLKIDSAPFELPSTLQFGLGYQRDLGADNLLQLSTTFQNSNFSGDVYNFGAEYSYNNLIFVRGGYSYVPAEQEAGYIYGLTAGVGLNYDMQGTSVGVDYAFRDVEVFSGNHVFSISIGF